MSMIGLNQLKHIQNRVEPMTIEQYDMNLTEGKMEELQKYPFTIEIEKSKRKSR